MQIAVAASVTVVAVALAGSSGSARAAASQCPDWNGPNMLAVAGGSPQTAQLGKRFQTDLQAALVNTNGCPLTGQLGGYSVHFAAPASGASGTFASTGSNMVTVGTDAAGIATAPAFTANDTAGSYSVHVDSAFGSTTLYLTNTATGLVALITATGATAQEASVNSQYQQPFQIEVRDANGQPVPGVLVSFTLGAGPYGASATFPDGSKQANELTDTRGEAASPLLLANTIAGSFTVTAEIAGTTRLASSGLRNLPGRPATVTAGAASGESTTLSHRFPVPLAVTVSDRYGNPVAGAIVKFGAPARGASGHFTIAGRRGLDSDKTAKKRAARVVTVRTNASGIAVAPPFTANDTAGGYVVRATVKGSTPHGSFALVNTPGR